MRTLQVIFCILSCLCVVAAVIVGAFVQNLVAVLCLLLGAVLCGILMFIVRARANELADQAEKKKHRDFMDPDE